jgi:hypothetical protein
MSDRRSDAAYKYGQVRLNLRGGADQVPYYIYGVRQSYEFDPEGFPVLTIDGQVYRHPIQLIQIALEDLSAYSIGGDSARLARAERYASELHRSLKNENNSGRSWAWIPLIFPNKPYPFVRPPWISGLVQGEALSLFVRLYRLTGDSVYMLDATLIAASFGVAPRDGGFTVPGPPGVVFEEDVSEPPTHILNGHISAALGLYDYAIESNDTTAMRLYRQGREWVISNLSRYDWHGLSYYDDPSAGWSGIGHPGYETLHPLLLQVMDGIQPDTLLGRYAARWERELWAPNFIPMYVLAKNYARARQIWRRHQYRDPTKQSP